MTVRRTIVIKRKWLFSFIFLSLFAAPVGAFLTSYLFVVWSSPGTELLHRLSLAGDSLEFISWCVHLFLTQFFISPIYALVPQYFEHSKLIGLVPHPVALLAGVAFYSALSFGLAVLCGCFGGSQSESAQ